MGERALEMLTDRIKDPKKVPELTVIATELVERESSL
jgi:LacI family transcriptional regulator